MMLPSFHLFTYDYSPAVGGAARYHRAVVAALGSRCTVTVASRDVHWTRYMAPIGALPRSIHCIVGEVLPLGTVAWSRWLRTRAPYSVMCHGLDLAAAHRSPRKRWIAARVLRSAAHVIVNSQHTARAAREAGAPAARIAVVPPPLGLDPAHGGHGLAALRRDHGIARERIVLSVGRIITRKGFDTLVDAMRIVQAAVSDVLLVVVGDGPERHALRTQASAQRVRCQIVTADDATLVDWYRACDVFAMLPRTLHNGDVEGFGMVYLEANAYGKPVVGTQSGGVPDAILHEVTGLLVPEHDPPAAARAIVRLLQDDALAERLGTNGRRRACEDFCHAQFTDRFLHAMGVPHLAHGARV